ncbi:hypothetical protein DL240_14915 [Lujinxingia litoralis]|uniref:Uncharacterized protein n=1 Tax=Lujinxingia litoralis TaxID=2211119 RepID=A0A328C7C0_9DELT|nr:hypothetical protein [Lujinxingia litoralis]RAL20959.1 hypothetical protein DL240_14915 [Lujinxingia litoralis]
MKEELGELNAYQKPEPNLEVRTREGWQAYLGDEVPSPGEAVAILHPQHERVYAAVVRHLGARRVELWAPYWPSWVEAGLAVERSYQTSAINLTPGQGTPGQGTPGHAIVVPESEGIARIWPYAPTLTELQGERPPLFLGLDAVDTIAPVVRGGLNLVIDTQDSPDHPSALFTSLASHIRRALSEESPELYVLDAASVFSDAHTLIAPGKTPDQQVSALRVAVALGAAQRGRHAEVLNVLCLPVLQEFRQVSAPQEAATQWGLRELVELLNTHLASTHSTRQTTLLYLGIPPHLGGLAEIIETLCLGEVDAQLVITPEGRFNPERSVSRADISDAQQEKQQQSLSMLARSSSALDRADLFGESELSSSERDDINQANMLKVDLRSALASM